MKGQKDIQRVEAERLHDIMATGLVPDVSGIAIDGGAHVGSWTVLMSEYFSHVWAFEPCAESFNMMLVNVAGRNLPGGVSLRKQALMDKVCRVDVVLPKGGRRTLTARQVQEGSEVEAVTIDSLDLSGCDLIKLDLEGAEGLALTGAAKTIKAFKPFLVIEFNGLAEQFGYTEADIIRQLTTQGYTEVWRDDVDRGFACKQR